MMENANTQVWNERQTRFIKAYRGRPYVSGAARLANVHRATVYRWLKDATFAAVLQAITDEYYREHRAIVIAEEDVRQQWRDERERQRRPMRCYFLALALAAKRKKRNIRRHILDII